MSKVGTLGWAKETNGALRIRDYVSLAGQAAVLQFGITFGPATARVFGMTRLPTEVELAAVRVPTTDAAVAAREICETHSAPYLVAHCLRTYYWAKVFAQRDYLVEHDDEVLYVACLLHDLGLTPAYARPRPNRTCFTLGAGETARQLANDAGWSARRVHAVEEAITLHINPRVRLKQGVEAHLVAAGAACDVVGARLDQIAGQTQEQLLQMHPRDRLKKNVIDDLHTFGDAPRTRAQFLLTAGQMERRVQRSEFAE